VNVVVVTPWPLTTAGGAQTVLRRLGEELLQRGFAVTAVVGSRGVHRMPCAVPEVRLPVAAMPASRRRVGASTLERLDEAVAALRPDVVLYAPHHSHEAHQAAAAAKALGVPFVYGPFVHTDQAAHTNREARAFARAADLVLCVTEGERRWLIERAGVAAPLLAGIGSDHANEPLPPRAGRRCALLSVGALSRHKRHEDQVTALSLLTDDVTLTIAGTRGDGEDRLRARIERLGLARRVTVAVEPSRDELLALYRASDAFLFTSRSESFGVALLDAICLGALPVVYPHAVYRELVLESGFGVVAERETPDALAAAILRALEIPRSAAPRDAFRSAHSWAAIGERVASALTVLVPSARHGA